MTTAAEGGFPFPSDAYAYPGAALHRHWDRLHRGDREPWPDARTVEHLVARHPGLDPPAAPRKAAEMLQSAWRCYHRGDFRRAEEAGVELGPLGFLPAVKAACIRATYLVRDPEEKAAALHAAARRVEEVQLLAPDLPNAWYLHGLALGRYGQAISVARALAEGLGGRIRQSLEKALALEPQHADAHIGLGTWHAEVIGMVGGFIGGLTYGARREEALRHFEAALDLNPDSAIARIEYAQGLLRLDGQGRRADALRLYGEAARRTPADAMERLDVELARTRAEG